MQAATIEALLTAYVNGTATQEEQEALQAALATNSNEAETKVVLEKLLQQSPPNTTYDPSQWSNMAQQIVSVDKNVLKATIQMPTVRSHRIHFLKTSWFRYAAAVFLLVGLYMATQTINLKKEKADIAWRMQNGSTKDVPPGDDRAVLTLANGTTIVLDTAANGPLAHQGNVQIIKLQDGQLKFVIKQVANDIDSTAHRLNTITTPRGGQYQLALPDGTRIWLNAATAFTFPTAFVGSQRQVKLDGEAYFEVVKDATHPFKVVTNGTTIQVLGTHFNVNAYLNEKSITTTLLEGKVRVQSGNSQVELLPGYQSRSANGSTNLNQHADTEEAVAWKEGYFQFAGAGVQTIMRQIGRWYNVDVHYVGDVSSAHITGEIPRTLTLQQVMKVLKESGISIWLEGDNQLYVAPGL